MALRDILLASIMLLGIFLSLRKPTVAAGFFMWLGLMMPHSFVYGFAAEFPWANIFAVVLLISVLRSGLDRIVKTFLTMWPMLLFLIWVSITSVTAFAEDAAVVKLIYVAKVLLGAFLVACSMNSKRDVIMVATVFTLSIAFFGLKGGPWVLMTGASSGSVRGPANSAIEDNNDIAVALVTVLPLLFWLFSTAKHRVYKLGLAFTMAMTLIAILGTYSRGGFVALGTSLLLVTLRSKSRLKIAMIAIPVLAAGLAFMPDKFWNRMSTIQSYEQDDSANGRLNAWKTAYNIANNKIQGAGFDYYRNPSEFSKYAPDGTIVRNVHSIFFAALGEHGYIGLGLLLTMVTFALRRTRSRRYDISKPASNPIRKNLPLAKGKADVRPGSDAGSGQNFTEFEQFRRMLQVSVVAFLSGAAFVNLIYWEGFYYLLILASVGLPLYAREEQMSGRDDKSTLPRRRPFPTMQPELRGNATLNR